MTTTPQDVTQKASDAQQDDKAKRLAARKAGEPTQPAEPTPEQDLLERQREINQLRKKERLQDRKDGVKHTLKTVRMLFLERMVVDDVAFAKGTVGEVPLYARANLLRYGLAVDEADAKQGKKTLKQNEKEQPTTKPDTAERSARIEVLLESAQVDLVEMAVKYGIIEKVAGGKRANKQVLVEVIALHEFPIDKE